MSTAAAELHFAAAFAAFGVAAAGLLLLVLRRRATAPAVPTGAGGSAAAAITPVGRVLAAAGLAVVATAGLLDGLGDLTDATTAGTLSLLGGAAVAAGAVGWRRPRTALAALALGGLAVVAAGLTTLVVGRTPGSPADVIGLAGSALIAVALLGASRSSVSARVAGASALTLVAVVLALSAALGSVITSSLQAERLRSLTARAGVEAAELSSLARDAVEGARFAGADLVAVYGGQSPDPLVGGAVDQVATRLGRLAALYPVGGFAYRSAAGTAPAVAGGVDAATAATLLATPGLTGVTCASGGGGGVAGAEGVLWAIGVFPLCAGDSPVGTVLRAVPVDRAYLVTRTPGDPSTTVAVVAGGRVTASGAAVAQAVTDAARRTTVATSAEVGGRAVALQPLADPAGDRVGTLVVTAPTTADDAARTRLLHTLFVVAVGGTALALLLAALVGDRITAGLRRLTRAAAAVQGGDTTARAAVGGDDEVGALGGAFDDMVVAIEEQTLALGRAAADEARLRARLEAVVAGMGEALVATDASGRVTEFNRAAAALVAVDRPAAIGAPAASLLDLADVDGRPLLETVASSYGTHAAVLTVGGAGVPVAVTAGPLVGPDGEPGGVVLVLRDLRREREVERMKSEFLSRIGHELRTPLTGILGYGQLLVRFGDQVPAGRGPAFAAEIVGSARRLLRIVEMLEFIAGSGAGRVVLAAEPVDTAEVVDAVVTGWAPRTPPGTEVVRRIGRGLPPAVADRRWLTLAIDELVDNAVKFSPDGGRVEVRTAAGPAGTIDISVRDRGKGMAPDELAAAFTDFAQGDSSDTRAYGGLGLGLAIVARVVDGVGGSVQCASRPGRGTTVTVRLAAAEGHAGRRNGHLRSGT